MLEAIIGVWMIVITYIAKRFWADQKHVILWLTIIMAVGYTIYERYAPSVFQEELIVFVTSVVWFSKIIYDALKVFIDAKR